MIEVLAFLIYVVIIAALIGVPMLAGVWLLGKYDALISHHHDQEQ
jgi:hypothetical protein